MKYRTSWKTRYGFYMAAIGSSFGLGNLWRFPFVVGNNGGGAFVSIYIFLALAVGLSLLIAELVLGKLARQSAVGSLETLTQPGPLTSLKKRSHNWVWFGRLSLFGGILLLSYYAVISGWALYFLLRSWMTLLGFGKLATTSSTVSVKTLMDNGLLQVGLASLHIVLGSWIVAKGLREGFERWIGIIMSLYLPLILFLVMKSLTLPGAEEALRFIFYPDFSKVNGQTLIQALGHVFFTLSIGMGSMVTFGSYMKEMTPIPEEGFRVTAMDTVISLFAGLLIFPIVFTAKVEGTSDPALLFETIPVLFSLIGMGSLFQFFFFLCLYIASLGATIGLLEGTVSHFVDRRKLNRKSSTRMVAGFVILTSLPAALSSSVFRQFRFSGLSMIQLLDNLLINWVLPVSALGISLAVGFLLDGKLSRKEIVDEDLKGTARLYRNWIFVLRWLAPALILGGLGLSILSKI